MEQRVQAGQSEGSLFRDPPPRRQPNETEGVTVQHPVISGQDARNASVGQNVRYVLGFGIAAIVIAFIVVYAVYFA
jgi:hypothetical protein